MRKSEARLARGLLVLTCLLMAPLPVADAFRFSQSGARDRVSSRLDALIRESGAEMVGIAFADLATGSQLLINPDEEFHAASTMKVPVMMEVFRLEKEGKLALDDYVVVKNDFISIADGSRYSIAPEDDSEQMLYQKIGQTESISELVRLMIVVSSNLATNLLMERVTAARVMSQMRALGATRMKVLRGVEDSRAFQRGLNNTATARDLMLLMRAIGERRAVSGKASDKMVQILADQQFNEGIPAGLPGTFRVAHKTGAITRINHDAAIVYPPGRKPYVLIVLTRGFADEKGAHAFIAEVSRVIYEGLVMPQLRAR